MPKKPNRVAAARARKVAAVKPRKPPVLRLVPAAPPPTPITAEDWRAHAADIMAGPARATVVERVDVWDPFAGALDLGVIR